MNYFIIGLLILFFVVRRQLQARPIKSDLFLLPVLLLFYGAYAASQASVGIGESISLALGLAMGLAIGWAQGFFTSVYRINGIWMEQGTPLSLAIWLLSVPVRFLIKLAFVDVFHISVHLTGSSGVMVPLLVSFAGILFGKAMYLINRYKEQTKEASGMTRRERKYAQRAELSAK